MVKVTCSLVHLKVYPKRLLCPSMKTIHSLITKIFENVTFVDRRTEGKPIVPSGQTGRGPIKHKLQEGHDGPSSLT